MTWFRPPREVVFAAVGVGALVLSYAAGRYTAPARVVERERVVTKTVEVTAKQTEVTHEVDGDVHHAVSRRVHTVRRPDGTIERDERTDTGSDVRTSRDDRAATVEVRYVDRDRVVEKLKLVEYARPNWAIGARAGLGLGAGPAYGGLVERRLAGPVWVGVYASTAKEVGAQVRLEF